MVLLFFPDKIERNKWNVIAEMYILWLRFDTAMPYKLKVIKIITAFHFGSDILE
jgi:hypothetical protein